MGNFVKCHLENSNLIGRSPTVTRTYYRIPNLILIIDTNMSVQPLWLRCEKREFERRAALTPTTAKKLLDAGFEIFVEKDEQRIFDDSEYEA